MKKYVLFALTVLFWAVETQGFAFQTTQIPPQNVEVEGKVSDTKVQVGQPFMLDLSLKVPKGWYVEWNDFDADTLSDQIDIIERGTVERTTDSDSNIVIKQRLTLMTFDTGQLWLPAVALTYARSPEDSMRMQALTNPTELYSSTIAVDTLQPYKPLAKPISAPIQMHEVYPWLLGVLLLALVAFGVWFWIKHRKRKVDVNGNVVLGPIIPPYEKAVGDLEALRQQKLWQTGKVKEYFSSLTDIAREYIEGQFGVNAVEMTTDDILEEVRPLHFSQDTFDKLKETMEVADLVKFAKYSASSLEYDNAMNNMSEFVNESYTHYQEMKAEEEARQAQMKHVKQDESEEKEDVKDV